MGFSGKKIEDRNNGKTVYGVWDGFSGKKVEVKKQRNNAIAVFVNSEL